MQTSLHQIITTCKSLKYKQVYNSKVSLYLFRISDLQRLQIQRVHCTVDLINLKRTHGIFAAFLFCSDIKGQRLELLDSFHFPGSYGQQIALYFYHYWTLFRFDVFVFNILGDMNTINVNRPYNGGWKKNARYNRKRNSSFPLFANFSISTMM